MKTNDKATKQLSEMERLAHLLDINFSGKQDTTLCLLIQDAINNLKKENTRLKATNQIMYNQKKNTEAINTINEVKQDELNYLDIIDSKFREINSILRKENQKLGVANEGLKKELEYNNNRIKELTRDARLQENLR